jgi:hypothetical protein
VGRRCNFLFEKDSFYRKDSGIKTIPTTEAEIKSMMQSIKM